jgi:hypothetical protein
MELKLTLGQVGAAGMCAVWMQEEHEAGNLARHEFVLACLDRHVRGDWGVVCEEDRRENDKSLATGQRIISAYLIPEALRGDGICDAKVWIITEWDRSVTTVLFPSDY